MPSSKNRIFFDASVLFTAALSPTGGSFRLITQARQKGFSVFSSSYAMDETIKNLKQDYPDCLANLKSILLISCLEILSNPSQKEIAKTLKLIDFKDAPILAAALRHKMDFLITLDRRHFFTQQLTKANLPCVILTPGNFIQKHFND